MKKERFLRLLGLISKFFVGQSAVQIINLVLGFLLIRWMSIETYAQYSVALGFQAMLGILVSLGFSGSIIALVGDQGNNKEILGSYIQSARYFRNRLFIFIIPLAAVIFHLVTSKHHWSLIMQLILFGSIAGSLFFQGNMSYYEPPLLIHQHLKRYYGAQIISAGARLLFCYLLYLKSILFSWTTVWINTIVFALNGFLYRKGASKFISEPKRYDPKINNQMVHYVSPLIPGIIFAAFQGQIAVLLITIFGRARNIAEVAALGRLGQLFFLLGTFNSVIIAPHIAKVPTSYLLRRYLQILYVAILISIAMCAAAIRFPQSLLWLLGPRYQHLHVEVSWMIIAASINYIGGVMWSMHSARKWIYWWGTWLYIALLLITQIFCILIIDLSTTLNVIYFSFITAIVVVLVHIINGIYGFIYGPNKLIGTPLLNYEA